MKFSSLEIKTKYNYQTNKDELTGQICLTSDNNDARIYLKMTHNELIEMLKIATPIFERSTVIDLYQRSKNKHFYII